MNKFNYGENLRIIRLTKGLCQTAMASQLDISQTTYSRIENNQDVVSESLNSEIAEALNVPATVLLTPILAFDENMMPPIHGEPENETENVLEAPQPVIESQLDLDQLQQASKIDLGLTELPIEPVRNIEGDQPALHTAPKKGFTRKAKENLSSRSGILLLLIALAILPNTTYSIARGFCAGLGTSTFISGCVSWTIALATIVSIFYWRRRLKKRVPKKVQIDE